MHALQTKHKTKGAIVAEVCREVGVSEVKLRVPGRGSQGAQARWMVGLPAMDQNSASLTEVARYFGRDVSPDPTKN